MPLTDQCQDSDGRLYKPYVAALADSQLKQAEPRLTVPPPLHVKSTARPCSCIDEPGRAVGGLHCDDGISSMA